MTGSPGVLWIKAAVVFIMGVGLGIYMAASGLTVGA